MIKNYFKIAWRNLYKDRQFTVLNVIGLSTGLACALLIWLWVTDERNVDKYNEKDSQLYQIMQNIQHENNIETMTHTAGLLADALKNEMPEVEYAATVVPASWFGNKGIIAAGDTKVKARGQFVSKDYFQVFTVHFVEGDNNKLASDKHSIAVSEELAMKLFHTTTGVTGKTIEWNQEGFNEKYTVTGVFENFPPNATIQPGAMFNYDQFFETNRAHDPLLWGSRCPKKIRCLKVPG